jgi:hypothetical protein
MQEVVKGGIDREISGEDYGKLYRSDLAKFADEFNFVLRKSFDIENRAKL